jgi:hypothetical protein
MLRRLRAPLFALGILGLSLSAGCPELPVPMPCGQIPAGGCPLGRGGTCDDPTCDGLYDCVDGSWTRAVPCSPDGGAGTGGGGGAEPGDAGPDACTPVNVNTHGQTSDCGGLENPDCPIEAAGSCEETACLTGCLDFFVCEQGSWIAVAYCDEVTGQFMVMP